MGSSGSRCNAEEASQGRRIFCWIENRYPSYLSSSCLHGTLCWSRLYSWKDQIDSELVQTIRAGLYPRISPRTQEQLDPGNSGRQGRWDESRPAGGLSRLCICSCASSQRLQVSDRSLLCSVGRMAVQPGIRTFQFLLPPWNHVLWASLLGFLGEKIHIWSLSSQRVAVLGQPPSVQWSVH